MINRAVLIVRPKQPYLDWAAGLDSSGLLPDPSSEQTAYLIPEFDSDEEALAILKKVYSDVFENELWGWHTDESAWPKRRTFAMFQKWFTVQLHSVVEDLCAYELSDDEV
jgi:hypothetical protein